MATPNDPITDIARAISDELDSDPLEIDPLENSVPTDALRDLLESDSESTLEFRHCGCHVVADTRGRVEVSNAAGSPRETDDAESDESITVRGTEDGEAHRPARASGSSLTDLALYERAERRESRHE